MTTALLDTIAGNAKAVDRNELSARYGIELLGSQQLFIRENLQETARQLREIAAVDLSVAFGIWAHTMVITYLRTADTDYVRYVLPALENGTRPGVTGMAPAFKEAAGAGTIDLTATPAEDGYVLNGTLAWASNLADDAVIVTAARTPSGERLLVAFDGCAPGVTLGTPFALLGLNATSSAGITLDNVPVPAGQVLSRDFEAFISAVRPTFLILQTSECLGVADAAIDAAATRLTGVNEVLTEDVEKLRAEITHLIHTQDLIAAVLDDGATVDRVKLLELRLDAARAAVDATALEVRVAGGAGYAQSSPASRRFREAAFIPVQSPSETQLTWELRRAKQEG
ncbi:MAG TPA: acyl-CoA/acyl-ACP dehydrogenase [Corynebacterium pollutisoli]|uniref:Acyl-CoA/acyl-ACP dehydrogenase n=1 Tax=Corynebacterium pollutisoli TaxID=1610489 RepID=A0A7X8MXN4_9CORY|nr:acyl-CoA/acyl-ACP dehydrogenase [Corynebacterium pollutisoli]HJD78780.1 acyl-CoA/acyl-ACP dehydrogenase [Corynebacterium pollutisoli]